MEIGDAWFKTSGEIVGRLPATKVLRTKVSVALVAEEQEGFRLPAPAVLSFGNFQPASSSTTSIVFRERVFTSVFTRGQVD